MDTAADIHRSPQLMHEYREKVREYRYLVAPFVQIKANLLAANGLSLRNRRDQDVCQHVDVIIREIHHMVFGDDKPCPVT